MHSGETMDRNPNSISDLATKLNGTTVSAEHRPPWKMMPFISSNIWRQIWQSYPPGFIRQVTAETIATYLLIFVTCGASALSYSDEHKVSKLGASIAGGLIVTVMIYAVGHISGAHMNPAVTFAFSVVRHFPWKQVTAETIATYLLVFVTCGASALSYSDEHKVSKLGASIAGGLIVTVMIYAVGHISGAHMNPVVTFAFAVVKHFPWKQVPFYATAQLAGATLASFTLRILLHPIKHVGTTSPSGTSIQALIMEIVVTFSLMFITAAVATDTKAIGELADIAVGFAVCITSILAGPISGGSMNPARSIGPAIASDYYNGIWVYIVGPFCGTLVGAWAYNFIRETDIPAHPMPNSISFKLGCIRSQNEQITNKDPFTNV